MNQTLAEKIMKLLRADKRAVSPADAAERTEETEDFERFLHTARELEAQGSLVFTKKGNLMATEANGLVRAKVVSQSRRFLFARPVDGGEDIFIPVESSRKAMLGDLILIGHIKQSARGPAGEVEKVLKLGKRTFTGKAMRGPNGLELKTDAAFRFPIPLKKEGPRLREGARVFAEVYMDKRGALRAKPLKTYGEAASARVCADSMIDEYGIPVEFPSRALEEAEAVTRRGVRPQDYEGRLDLRDALIFTIDGEDAKDLDDAISVTASPEGYRLGVHIADVSHYVRQGTALDTEAFARGTSVYFADRVIPMLPKAISNGICSLNAGEDKLAFSALLTLDKEGNLTGYSFQKTVISSKVRGVYSEVNRLFDGTAGQALKKKYAPVAQPLQDARTLANILKKRAAARGTMDLESRESRFVLDENGVCIAMHPRKSGEAEQLIEQLMIAANQAAARFAREKGIPFLYRVHEEPSADRLQSLGELAALMGFDTRRLKEGARPSDLSALLEKAKDTPYARVISHQLLRTMAKARYDARPIGHFGLALADYCHFTSPIRRYPDTAIHRILSDLAAGVPAAELKKRYASFVEEAAGHATECEIRAMMAERNTEACYAAEFMHAHIGEQFDGVVSGVTEWGVYVELENSAEGFIRAEYLPNGMEYDGALRYKSRAGRESLTIGDALRVLVTGADVSNGQVDFIPAPLA